MLTRIIILVVIVALLVGAWVWYTNTPGYRAAKAKKDATRAALEATGSSPVGLQRGVNDVLDAGEAQRRLGYDVDPGLDAIRLVRNSYQDIPVKWNEERSTDVSDPARRVNIMANLAGMFEATTQLFVRTIPYITSLEGLAAAKQLYLQMATDSTDRRNCWWSRDTGCWRNWSVAEPHEDDRLKEEQNRFRDFSRRVLPALEDRARALHTELFTPAELNSLHQKIHGDPTKDNPFDEQTFTLIQGWVH